LLNGGGDQRGAALGLADWTAEEVLIRTEALDKALWMLRRGYLRIDDDGRIWRTHIQTHGRWKPIIERRAENVGGKGYFRLTLQVNGHLRSVMAHRVVWTWLKGPIPAGLEVNHKDLNKQNNRVANFELVTGAGNIQHSYANGRTRPWSRSHTWRGRPRVTAEQVEAIKAARRSGALLREIAEQFAISLTHVQRICAQ
jgi:hypothetical protein